MKAMKVFRFIVIVICSLPTSRCFEYSITDLPSVQSFLSHCDHADANASDSNSFVVTYDYGKLKHEEIQTMVAIFYELPSGEPQRVDLVPASHETNFSTNLLRPHTRYLAFLTVRLLVRNGTTNSLTDWLWSQKYNLVTCGTEDRSNKCLCDLANSFNTTCRRGVAECHCASIASGSDCGVCLDGTYRDYSDYYKGCLPCRCAELNFAGPCAWRHVGAPGMASVEMNRRRCIDCKPGYEGESCLPIGSGGMGLAAKVFISLACLLGVIFLLAAFVVLRRHCRRRALRAARHSLAVQRLFSRFKDDTSLEAEAAEASAILAEEDTLQRTTQQLRLGADPVYQPTTVSIT